MCGAGEDRVQDPLCHPLLLVMYRLLVLLPWCQISEVRDSVVEALGHINHVALRDFICEKVINEEGQKGVVFLLEVSLGLYPLLD